MNIQLLWFAIVASCVAQYQRESSLIRMVVLFEVNFSSYVDDCHAFKEDQLCIKNSLSACASSAVSKNTSKINTCVRKYDVKSCSSPLDGISCAAYAALSCFFIFVSMKMSRNLIHARKSNSLLKCPQLSFRSIKIVEHQRLNSLIYAKKSVMRTTS